MKNSPRPNRPRLAVVCDYPEEGWASMDLVAEMLMDQLASRHSNRMVPFRVCPMFRRHLARLRSALPAIDRQPMMNNVDRLLNRQWQYPRFLRKRADEFDLFHICDHSYAQLVHALPEKRTGVFCHDLDTFRCLLAPRLERRPGWFKWMARRSLTGMQKAAVVFYTTDTVREQIEHYGLLDARRLVKAPLGVSPDFSPVPLETPARAEPGILPLLRGNRFLLHVGSCIPRKRIDVLLEIFASLRPHHAGLRLVQVGGAWTDAQSRQIHAMGIEDDVIQVRGLTRAALAEMYRRAAAVLVTSEAEGFGLPIIEALACAAPVFASELPVFREVGGDALVYCPVGDAPSWTAQIERLIADPQCVPSPAARLMQAGKYSWQSHADIIANAYAELLSDRRGE